MWQCTKRKINSLYRMLTVPPFPSAPLSLITFSMCSLLGDPGCPAGSDLEARLPRDLLSEVPGDATPQMWPSLLTGVLVGPSLQENGFRVCWKRPTTFELAVGSIRPEPPGAGQCGCGTGVGAAWPLRPGVRPGGDLRLCWEQQTLGNCVPLRFELSAWAL